jgi:hypothetical protein
MTAQIRHMIQVALAAEALDTADHTTVVAAGAGVAGTMAAEGADVGAGAEGADLGGVDEAALTARC